MAIDIKTILKQNSDLDKRMAQENWVVNYDKKADVLTLGTKFPKNSGNVYINEKEGSIIRVGEDNKIYGFVFENYKTVFLTESSNAFIFWLLFLPVTYRFGILLALPIYIYFKISSLTLKGIKSLKELRNNLVIKNELSQLGYV